MDQTHPAIEAPEHSPEYRQRRFFNWFPLGLTYAALYMGRYNLTAAKSTMGRLFHLDKTQIGVVFTVGFWVYALSVMLNGPLADRVGGRRAILVGAFGASMLNAAIGLLFLSGWTQNVVVGLSILYAINMYFQSFGALSVVKVNASWFHVRERGVFGGIFGVMISSGYWLALSVGGIIIAKLPWYWVFLVPSLALATMFVVDFLLVRDRPSDAGFKDFDTGDASSDSALKAKALAEGAAVVEPVVAEKPLSLRALLAKIFSDPVIRVIAMAEFCTGFVRQGLLIYFLEYLAEVHGVRPGMSVHAWAGVGPTLGGIAGGLVCGTLSDRYFQSRRPPVAFIFYIAQALVLLALGFAPNGAVAAFLVGFSCMFIFGVHGMLSGTASMDFGGRKAAATAAGILDGVQYVAAGLTGFGLGYILQRFGWDGHGSNPSHHPHDARVWVFSIIPFSLIGAMLMTRIWNAKPSKGGGH
ncbi:MAG: MFS transporter [Deltaproteobacteria bacterium]|nr:MFS transporter [Deltaproteobacteria bacterium]